MFLICCLVLNLPNNGPRPAGSKSLTAGKSLYNIPPHSPSSTFEHEDAKCRAGCCLPDPHLRTQVFTGSPALSHRTASCRASYPPPSFAGRCWLSDTSFILLPPPTLSPLTQINEATWRENYHFLKRAELGGVRKGVLCIPKFWEGKFQGNK